MTTADTYHATRLAHYLAKGHTPALAQANADADTHMTFRNEQAGKDVVALFTAFGGMGNGGFVLSSRD